VKNGFVFPIRYQRKNCEGSGLMKKYIITSAAVALLAFATSAFPDDQKRISFDTLFSGSAVSTTIDTDGDGFKALLVMNKGVDKKLGPVSFEEVVESRPKAPAVFCTTPNGGPGIEFELVQGHRVLRVERSGSLILMRFDFDTQCVSADLATDDSLGFQGQLSVTGGTGRFANASGTITFKGSGSILLINPTGIFAVIKSAHEFGTIHLED
jgi:hypothetical protein